MNVMFNANVTVNQYYSCLMRAFQPVISMQMLTMSTCLRTSYLHCTQTFLRQVIPFLPFAGFCIGLIFSVAKGAFGDMFRALGLGIILSFMRSWSISSMYPLLPQIRSVSYNSVVCLLSSWPTSSMHCATLSVGFWQ
jgi:hypothetical protein